MIISIITPSFNQASYLEQTIDSILSQNFPHLRYIIIDGGSTDGSLEIIKKYDKHLTYWVSEKDCGQSHAINKGLKKAEGDVVQWINSDDWLEAGALQKINEYFKDPEINVLCGKSQIQYPDGSSQLSFGTDIYENNFPRTLGQARIDQPETWFRWNIFSELLPLCQDLHYVMDKHIWMKYLLNYGLKGIVKTDDVLVNFRIHNESKTGSENKGFFTETIELIIDLARVYGRNFLAQRISDITGITCRNEYFTDVKYKDKDAALNHSLLQLADEYYVFFDYSRSKMFFELIEPSVLDSDQFRRYKKLKRGIYWRLNFFKKWM